MPTITHEEFMMQHLADPENARVYLQVSLEEYLEDGDLDEFVSSVQWVVKAQSHENVQANS